jgi:uncharacterized membrane protein
MSYRDELRNLASKLEDLRTDLHRYAQDLDNMANKIDELEKENARLKAGK